MERKNTSQSHDRKALRLSLRAARKSLNSDEQHLAAQQLSYHIQQHPPFTTSTHIATYLANDGEISAHILTENDRSTSVGKQFYYPVTTADKSLAFRAGNGEWTLNQYGILEPNADQPTIDPKQLDIIFLPLVGFDRRGNRLGMGGGYYDRALETVVLSGAKTQLIGLAHSLQEVDQIEPCAWDIRLNSIITEKECIIVAGQDE